LVDRSEKVMIDPDQLVSYQIRLLHFIIHPSIRSVVYLV
jgi:hypothetical protein